MTQTMPIFAVKAINPSIETELRNNQILKLQELSARNVPLYQLSKSRYDLKGQYDTAYGYCSVVRPLKNEFATSHYDMIGEKLTCEMDMVEYDDGVSSERISGDTLSHYEFVTHNWVMFPFAEQFNLIISVSKAGLVTLDTARLASMCRFLTGELDVEVLRMQSLSTLQGQGLSQGELGIVLGDAEVPVFMIEEHDETGTVRYIKDVSFDDNGEIIDVTYSFDEKERLTTPEPLEAQYITKALKNVFALRDFLISAKKQKIC